MLVYWHRIGWLETLSTRNPLKNPSEDGAWIGNVAVGTTKERMNLVSDTVRGGGRRKWRKKEGEKIWYRNQRRCHLADSQVSASTLETSTKGKERPRQTEELS